MSKEEFVALSRCCAHYDIDAHFIRSLEEAGLVSITEQDEEYYLPFEQLGSLD